MCNTPLESYVHLPSPPLSPFHSCEILCNEMGIESKDLKIETTMGSPVEYSIELDIKQAQEELMRNKYMNMMEEGVQLNGELIPYLYFVQKLHSLGNKVINKKTKDAVPLRVYETGKDTYQEFWVHPIYLTLQSYQFFKYFEEVKANNEQVLEIEVPSLKTFAVVLYWIYTGDKSKVLEIAKIDDTLCKGIMENIQCLEVNMA